MSFLACGGHLLIDLPIFMGPVLLLVGWLLLMTRRARAQEADVTGSPRGLGLEVMGPSHGAGLREGRLSP
jgi:hypothetical protein